MTIIERVKTALKADDYDKDSLDKLIAMAYYIGRESATKKVSDNYSELIREQNKRADECRYSRMAHYIVGDKKYIHHADYAGEMTALFGSDETKF